MRETWTALHNNNQTTSALFLYIIDLAPILKIMLKYKCQNIFIIIQNYSDAKVLIPILIAFHVAKLIIACGFTPFSAISKYPYLFDNLTTAFASIIVILGTKATSIVVSSLNGAFDIIKILTFVFTVIFLVYCCLGVRHSYK